MPKTAPLVREYAVFIPYDKTGKLQRLKAELDLIEAEQLAGSFPQAYILQYARRKHNGKAVGYPPATIMQNAQFPGKWSNRGIVQWVN